MIRASVRGDGTKDLSLYGILLGRENSELKLLKDEYNSDGGKTLHEDIDDDTSGHYGKLLLSCSDGGVQDRQTGLLLRDERKHFQGFRCPEAGQTGFKKEIGSDGAEDVRPIGVRTIWRRPGSARSSLRQI